MDMLNETNSLAMPEKPRKTPGDVNSLAAVSLRNLIDTLSKDTIRTWRPDYAGQKVLPIFDKHCPEKLKWNC